MFKNIFNIEKFRQIILLLIIILIPKFSFAKTDLTINLFEKKSYQKILIENKNSPFLIVLWSINCPPCYDELKLLGQYTKMHPQLNIILISTDSPSHIKEVKEVLVETIPNIGDLQTNKLWIFSDIPSEQLRYTIDPSWYGELPRSYFLNQLNERKAFSGKLTTKILNIIFN